MPNPKRTRVEAFEDSTAQERKRRKIAVQKTDELRQIKQQTNVTAQDLVAMGNEIQVKDATITGMLPLGYYSYPGFKLDPGESPDDPCNVIDIPAPLFNKIAPTSVDLSYLAHIRETATIDKEDAQVTADQHFAVVLGNRLPKDNATNHAFLVSLEDMGAILPSDDGSSHLPENTQYVRLIYYKSWSFTVNTLDQDFKSLLENLNKDKEGQLDTVVTRY